jgi:hypothetical protein
VIVAVALGAPRCRRKCCASAYIDHAASQLRKIQ